MPSLPQLRQSHPNLLLIDSASSRVQVGLWRGTDSAGIWKTAEGEAGTLLFKLVGEILTETGSQITDLDALVFCEGPGSVLGIRTAAMALRTWQVLKPMPAYTYQSLALVAAASGLPLDVTIIADARRQTWHAQQTGQPLRRLSAAELTAPLYMPEGFRFWSPLPAGVQTTSYDVKELLGKLGDADLFAISESPDAFLHEEPSYVTWTPQVHQAPSPTSK